MNRIWIVIAALGLAVVQAAPAQKPPEGKSGDSGGKSKPAAKIETIAKAETPAKGDPAVKPDAAPKDPARKPGDEKKPADTPQEDPLAKIFGEGGVNVKAEKIYSEIDPEKNELKTMHMEGKVIIRSEQMNIDCDDLFIDMEKQQMLAKGQVVRFEKTDVNGTCGRLTYDIEDKKTLLEGKPKPVIIQKDANGQTKQTSANRITMVQNEKANNVSWEGDVEFQTLANPNAGKEAGEKKAPPPQKIDNNSVSQIRNAEKPEKSEKTEKQRAPAIDVAR